MKNYIYTIAFTFIFFTHLYLEGLGPKMPKGAESLTQTLENLVHKPWYQFMPTIGDVDVPHEKMASHRSKIERYDFMKIGGITHVHPNFQIIKYMPSEMFQKLKSPYFWGYAKNLNNRPFIGVTFKVKDIATGQQVKNKDNGSEVFAIAFTYGWTEDDKKSGTTVEDLYGGRTFWITTGGDGAHYLGQYAVRSKDATEQDMKDIATLIATGKVIRNIQVSDKDKKSYELVLADIKDIK